MTWPTQTDSVDSGIASTTGCGTTTSPRTTPVRSSPARRRTTPATPRRARSRSSATPRSSVAHERHGAGVHHERRGPDRSGTDATSGIASIPYYYCSGTSCTPATRSAPARAARYPVTWSSMPADGSAVLAKVIDTAGNSMTSAKQRSRSTTRADRIAHRAGREWVTVRGNAVPPPTSRTPPPAWRRCSSSTRQPREHLDDDRNRHPRPYRVTWDTTPYDGPYDLR